MEPSLLTKVLMSRAGINPGRPRDVPIHGIGLVHMKNAKPLNGNEQILYEARKALRELKDASGMNDPARTLEAGRVLKNIMMDMDDKNINAEFAKSLPKNKLSCRKKMSIDEVKKEEIDKAKAGRSAVLDEWKKVEADLIEKAEGLEEQLVYVLTSNPDDTMVTLEPDDPMVGTGTLPDETALTIALKLRGQIVAIKNIVFYADKGVLRITARIYDRLINNLNGNTLTTVPEVDKDVDEATMAIEWVTHGWGGDFAQNPQQESKTIYGALGAHLAHVYPVATTTSPFYNNDEFRASEIVREVYNRLTMLSKTKIKDKISKLYGPECLAWVIRSAANPVTEETLADDMFTPGPNGLLPATVHFFVVQKLFRPDLLPDMFEIDRDKWRHMFITESLDSFDTVLNNPPTRINEGRFYIHYNAKNGDFTYLKPPEKSTDPTFAMDLKYIDEDWGDGYKLKQQP